MHDACTSDDCGGEWRAAGEMLPFMTLTRACFGCLPMIQTALALRVLGRLGRFDDPLVARAYEGLASEEGKDAERSSSFARALRRAGELREWVIAGAE